MPPLNPYAGHRTNPDLFFGASRRSLLEVILDAGVRARSLAVCGGRRMGKTTLLRRAEAEAERRGLPRGVGGLRVVPARIDFGSPGAAAAPLAFLWVEIATALDRHSPPGPPDEGGPPLGARLRRVFREAGDPTHLLLLIDNVDRVLDAPAAVSLADNFRALISDEPGVSEHLAVVFAGAADLHKFRRGAGSPLANLLRWHSLELLEPDDIGALTREPLPGAPADDAFVAELHALSGGHPFIAQSLLEEVGAERTQARLRQVAAQFLQTQRVFFDGIWDQCGRSVRLMYAEMDAEAPALSLAVVPELAGEDEAASVLERLCYNGIARVRGDRLELANELFRQWYRRHGRTRVLPPEEQQVRDLLLDHLEPRLKRLCDTRLAATTFKDSRGWRRAQGGRRATEDRFYFGDYFQLLNEQVALFEADLKFLGANRTEIKRAVDERARLLGPVRNALCHPAGGPIDAVRLARARGAVLELLTHLPEPPAGGAS